MRCGQNRNDLRGVARLVEVLQVETIAIDLFKARAIEPASAQLLLDDEDDPLNDHNEICTSSHPGDEKRSDVKFCQFSGPAPDMYTRRS